MTKLSLGRAAFTCLMLVVLGCGSAAGSTPSSVGEAGTTAPASPGTDASAGVRAPAAGTTAAGWQTGASGASSPAKPAASGGSGGAVAAAQGGSGGAGAAVAGGAGGASPGGAGAPAGAGASGAGGKAGNTTPPPDGGKIDETIVVRAGETFDGEGKRFSAGSALGDGSQDEGQQPLFRLEDGATLENVVLADPAADGVHCHGDVTLRNIVWEDIGEDALTIKEPGTVTLDGGSATNGDDKVFQVNAESTFKVSNFKASNAGKFIRQNGDTKFKVAVVIDSCDISNMDEAIFRTDSDVSTVEMTNTRYSKIGDELFIGVAAANIKTNNNTEY